jgi:hypothetical protein
VARGTAEALTAQPNDGSEKAEFGQARRQTMAVPGLIGWGDIVLSIRSVFILPARSGYGFEVLL